ncbi:MAG TPA: hypothetical protein VMZ28_04550, partial [Kofleriaceae bacterium]|nr:hypothetical protein [Kofleriaceae bacterium]
LVSERGLLGSAVIRAVAPSATMDTCRTGTFHDVTLEVSALQGTNFAVWGLQGVQRIDNVHALPGVTVIPALPLRDPERLWAAFDRDGDTVADMAVTAGECPADQAPPNPSVGRQVTAACIDYWFDDGHGYARAARDIAYQCM